ncbi:DctP family TRAP transporter solute-binding subunit [Microbacterium marinilacus]|uniref:Sialic acid TRAP transporter substrate-binding protein SiaP n=1 Tax=Microbacterium marinilacus TaxID=415209 RepID=A0ABP7BRF5_9MICO|nr:DctP family TRAP transporter solute-binding subunit [Microbacterium marinilacus]MBY0689201.1 DctP family TRAP transporter solute-binding subunit [Microbacterium marinilacus]
MKARRGGPVAWVAAAAVPAMMLTGCANGDGGSGGTGSGGEIELTLAHSYNESQPQHRCGAQVIADEVEAADVGLSVEIFPSSQLGGDADRISAVASGDIDLDIQGASALGAVYEPISVLDAAYVFDDADHLAAFMASDESRTVIDGFAESAGVQTLGAWSAGARHFTANEPIREPDDLQGLRIRFPGSPQFLLNAQALGASATEVAYEELYLALQQGTVDGQENPITNIEAQNLAEVQDYLSLTAHQLNTNLVIAGPVWNDLSDEQQAALTAAVESAVAQVTECVTEDEEATIEEWRAGGDWEVVDDVDIDAFREAALAYLEGAYTDDSLAVFEAIRATAG